MIPLIETKTAKIYINGYNTDPELCSSIRAIQDPQKLLLFIHDRIFNLNYPPISQFVFSEMLMLEDILWKMFPNVIGDSVWH